MQIIPPQASSLPEISTFDQDHVAAAPLINIAPLSRAARGLLETLIAFAIMLFVFNALFVIVPVQDFTMSPLLPPGNTVITSCSTYWLLAPQRGDIASVRDISNVIMLRRVIGVPGDRVELSGGQVLVNGEVLNEPYATADFNLTNATFKLKDGEYFVLADNRNLATRTVGIIQAQQIMARAWLVIWPFDRLGKLKN